MNLSSDLLPNAEQTLSQEMVLERDGALNLFAFVRNRFKRLDLPNDDVGPTCHEAEPRFVYNIPDRLKTHTQARSRVAVNVDGYPVVIDFNATLLEKSWGASSALVLGPEPFAGLICVRSENGLWVARRCFDVKNLGTFILPSSRNPGRETDFLAAYLPERFSADYHRIFA